MVSADARPVQIGAALREAKRSLRESTQAARDALARDARAAASRRIADRLAVLPSFVAARSILVTMPFRSEWDSRLIAAIALDLGKTVASPRVDPAARMLSLHRIMHLDSDVAPGYRGIPEPASHRPQIAPSDIDWVLVPGVAFDASGRRLGYGGGYYDRLVPLLSPGVPRVAGAFEVQIVDHVPTGPHDLAVDSIVTESRTIAVG